MNHIEEIRRCCRLESERKASEAKRLYKERIDEIEARAIPPVPCIQLFEGKGRREWVRASDIYMKSAFNYHHHPKSEVVDFAVKHRGNPDLLIAEMDDLHLEEYPAPVEGGKIYIVSKNGNHRSLVYKCLNFPFVEAYRGPDCTGEWKCAIGWTKTPRRILNWLYKRGLITAIRINDGYVIFRDETRFIGWVLPTLTKYTLEEIIEKVDERLEICEKAFQVEGPKKLRLFKHKKICEFAINLSWIISHKEFKLPYET